jgi:hypothetical protein
MTDLHTVQIIVTVASENAQHLDEIVNEIEEAAGAHPAVLTISVKGEDT